MGYPISPSHPTSPINPGMGFLHPKLGLVGFVDDGDGSDLPNPGFHRVVFSAEGFRSGCFRLWQDIQRIEYFQGMVLPLPAANDHATIETTGGLLQEERRGGENFKEPLVRWRARTAEQHCQLATRQIQRQARTHVQGRFLYR